jgi:hypothetical protein
MDELMNAPDSDVETQGTGGERALTRCDHEEIFVPADPFVPRIVRGRASAVSSPGVAVNPK